MLTIEPPDGRVAPLLDGRPAADEEWCLDTAQYAGFVASTTGLRLTDDPSAADCYRIGNRLEAYIEERKRAGEWDPSLVADLPAVESLQEVLWVARFLRRCHESRLEN